MATGSFATLAINLEARMANLEQGLADATKKTEAAADRMSDALKKVEKTGERVGETLVAYFGIDAFKELIKGAIEAEAHLNDLAKRTQLTAEQIGGIGFAASLAGASTEEAAFAFGRLNLSLAKAASGNKEASNLYSLVGVNVKDAAGNARDANAVFADLADKFASYADGPEKAALGNAVFGRSYQILLPLLQEGGAKLRENVEFYNKYSGVTNESAAAANEFTSSLAKLHVLTSAFGTNLANALLPTLQAVVERFIAFKEAGNAKLFVDALTTGINALVISAAYLIERLASLGRNIGYIYSQVKTLHETSKDVTSDSFSSLSSFGNLLDNGPVGFVKKVFNQNASTAKTLTDMRDAADAAGNKAYRDLVSGIHSVDAGHSPEGDNLVSQVKPAPKLPAKNAASGVLDDPTRKELAATLAMLDDEIKKEQELLTERNQFLDLYNARGLISIRDYYKQRQNIADEAFAKEENDLIDGLAALEVARDKALSDKNPKNKPQERVADLDKQIEQRETRLAVLRQKYGADAIANTEKGRFAQEDFQKTLDATSAKVLELRGALVAAAAINFDQQNESLTKLFTANKNAEGLKSLAILKDHALALAGLAEITKSSAREDEALQSAEERLTLAQQAGGIGELQMLAETGKARAERVRLMEVEVGIQEAIARRDGDKDAMAAADKARLALDKLKATVNPLAERINGVFENSLSNAFSGFISGSRNAAQAFGDFAKSVINDLLKIASQEIAKSIFGGTGGLGGLLSRWFSGGASGGFGSGAAFGFQDLGQYLAVGGVERPYSMARVNEHGPEMLTVQGKDYLMTGDRSSRVTPAGAQAQSGPSITVNIASGVSRNELAALIPSLKTQIKAELIASQRRPGYAGA